MLGPPAQGHHSFNAVPESLIRCALCATHWPQMHRSQRAAGQATGLVSSQAAEEKGTHSRLRPPASARDTGRRVCRHTATSSPRVSKKLHETVYLSKTRKNGLLHISQVHGWKRGEECGQRTHEDEDGRGVGTRPRWAAVVSWLPGSG